MSRVIRLHPHHEDEERRFFDRGGRRQRGFSLVFEVDHDELLADLDPGRLTWRAAGCPADGTGNGRSAATSLTDVA